MIYGHRQMILQAETLRLHTKKSRANKFSKFAGYKMNTQKPVMFLYTRNEQSKKEIKTTITFAITSKRIKYLVINLTKLAKNL